MNTDKKLRNRVEEMRKSRGIGQTDLAKRAGVSRQTIHDVEAGLRVPSTDVALRLARELESTVEELFSLPPEPKKAAPDYVAADFLSSTRPVKGQAVRISRVGSRLVGVPVSASPYYLPEADGVVGRVGYTAPGEDVRAGVAIFDSGDADRKRLVLAGCDPATNLLARMVEKISGTEVVAAGASSKLALTWLKEGKVHVAGSHLEDPITGEFNLPYLKREFPNEDFTVVTFAHWEEGLVVAAGNPKEIHKIEHLVKKDVQFVNREPGSGSRALLDQLLTDAGVASRRVMGYDRVALGHLAAAYCVVSGEADCCLATRSAARTFRLDFLPFHFERYDLVMRKSSLDLPAVQDFLDVLQRKTLRRQLEVLAGYDTEKTGAVVGARA